MNERMIDYNILKRDFEINQQLYETLLQRLKDATLSASLQVTNVHVIDPAPSVLAGASESPQPGRGLMIGLILGVTLAFVQEAMDSSVRTTEEAERLVNAPALAIIPPKPMAPAENRWLPMPPPRRSGRECVGLSVLTRPSSPMAEAFRSLRTSVLLSTAPRPPQTLLVTSARWEKARRPPPPTSPCHSRSGRAPC